VERERRGLDNIRSRPVMADPMTPIRTRREEIERTRATMRREIEVMVERETRHVESLRARVSALGPSATLARGYSIVQVVPKDGSGPEVVTSYEQSPPAAPPRTRGAAIWPSCVAAVVRISDDDPISKRDTSLSRRVAGILPLMVGGPTQKSACLEAPPDYGPPFIGARALKKEGASHA